LTGIPELWSEADSKAEEALRRAAQESDLLSALVAVEGLEDEAAMAVARRIAEWAVQVRLGREAGKGPRDAIADVLVKQAGLIGDTTDYFAPDNSRISAVLARRRGQPILLSCVWMLVGRAAGIDVVGVGLPGHFVVGVEGLVVDPFAGGRYLSNEQCRELAARAMPGRPFDKDWLAPVGVRSVAARVLRNLSHSLREAGDERGVYRATRMLATALPDDGPVWVELARQTEAHGAWPEALSMYRHVARHFAGRREGQIGEMKAIELESRTRVLN
jgi:regulator of sirC expression with transglutaminase-like and TPR domain